MDTKLYGTSLASPDPETNPSELAALRAEVETLRAKLAGVSPTGQRVVRQSSPAATPRKPYAHPGATNGRAFLTDETVMDIYRSTEGTGAIAARYGVHVNTVYQIRNGLRWQSVTGHVYTRRNKRGQK